MRTIVAMCILAQDAHWIIENTFAAWVKLAARVSATVFNFIQACPASHGFCVD